jgi:DNA polymerase III subunit epsilon
MSRRRMEAVVATTPRSEPGPLSRFAAIDFETADEGRDSACSMAIVVVEGLEVVARSYHLIRPPRRRFVFTYIHGLTWKDVANKPAFGEVWDDASAILAGVEFIAAHSASFDRSVLYNCCAVAGHPLPAQRFQCTVKLARQSWNLNPAKLPDVCRHLRLELQHHQAESDANACAQIVIAALRQGLPLSRFLGKYNGYLPISARWANVLSTI